MTPRVSSTSSSKSTRPLRVGLGRRVSRRAGAARPGSSSNSSRRRSSRIGRSCTRSDTSLRSRPSGGSRPLRAAPSRACPRRDAELAADRRRGVVEHVDVGVGVVAARREEPRLDRAPAAHALDPTAALRQPDVAQAAAEETALPALSGTTPSAPSRRSTASASTPSPSSAQRSSYRQTAQRRHAQRADLAPPAARNSGRARRSGVDPAAPRPAAAIAASAFVTSSGTICVRSIPAWAKFSRK